MASTLITYFSLTGRTKRAAETIAAELTNFSTILEPITYTGNNYRQDAYRLQKIDESNLEMKPAILDLTPYDLVCIGMPVHGGCPAIPFDSYMGRLKGMEGKKVLIFATCRLFLGKTRDIMYKAVEERGGAVVGEIWVKNFFSLKLSSVKEAAAKLNKKIID